MKRTCSHCHRKAPKLVAVAKTSEGKLVDECCGRCFAVMVDEKFLWERRPSAAPQNRSAM